MKILIRLSLFTLLIGSTATSCKVKEAVPPPPPPVVEEAEAVETAVETTTTMANQVDTLSYSLGVLLGTNLKNQGFDELNTDVVAAAIADVYAGNAQVDPNQANAMVGQFMEAKNKAKFAKNVEAGAAFLAENGKKDGVTTLASGLQYEVIKQGTGPKPTINSKVKTHYHGTLIDGTVFDSSVQRGEPISFPVSGVISGWTEALQLMPVGSKWRLFIPSNLAYGERDMGTIKPFSTLIFEVELLGIE